MLSNSERTISVIRKAMEKHGFEGNPEDYTLAQFLPDGGRLTLHLCHIMLQYGLLRDVGKIL